MGVTVAQALRQAAEQLSAAGLLTPELDASALLAHVTGLGRTEQIADPEQQLDDDQLVAFESQIAKRVAHIPVSRLIGTREFWSLPFKIGPEVLDPRPDSETLVEAALDWLGDRPPAYILDLGTGSGCLLLAILSERPGDRGVGIDVSDGALAIASRNAVALGLADRASFQKGHWCDGLEPASFDLVVSNPPYIASSEIADLAPEVRDQDPHLALDGGPDGLDAYRALVAQVRTVLRPEGRLYLEVGATQCEPVSTLLLEAGWAGIETRKDLAGHTRCVSATFGR